MQISINFFPKILRIKPTFFVRVRVRDFVMQICYIEMDLKGD